MQREKQPWSCQRFISAPKPPLKQLVAAGMHPQLPRSGAADWLLLSWERVLVWGCLYTLLGCSPGVLLLGFSSGSDSPRCPPPTPPHGPCQHFLQFVAPCLTEVGIGHFPLDWSFWTEFPCKNWEVLTFPWHGSVGPSSQTTSENPQMLPQRLPTNRPQRPARGTLLGGTKPHPRQSQCTCRARVGYSHVKCRAALLPKPCAVRHRSPWEHPKTMLGRRAWGRGQLLTAASKERLPQQPPAALGGSRGLSRRATVLPLPLPLLSLHPYTVLAAQLDAQPVRTQAADKRREAFIYYSAISRVSVPQCITLLPIYIIYFLVQHR